ncbi:MAG: discoidin domain-containing protein [Candidatus Oleimicrobiaceae bacterium]
MRCFLFTAGFTLWLGVLPVGAQPRLLDDWERLEGWEAIASEGALLRLSLGDGKSGNALLMEFDLTSGSGYVGARKSFVLDLPADYRFSFDLRAEAPINNFEFKLLDSLGNVFWMKRLHFDYPRDWKRVRVGRRQISFAWGPSGGGELKRTQAIEFVVSTGTGGIGKVWIDNFCFEPLERQAPFPCPRLSFSEALGQPQINATGDTLRGWILPPLEKPQWLEVDFGVAREVGGLVLDWESDRYASAYTVELSPDGATWEESYRVTDGNGGRDCIPTPEGEGRAVRLRLLGDQHRGTALRQLVVRGPEFSASVDAVFGIMAGEQKRGLFPKYFYGAQSYWTVFGAEGDDEEALINEEGMIEAGNRTFALEPFLRLDGTLYTWADVVTSQGLEQEYWPVPWVRWDHPSGVRLEIKALVSGGNGASELWVRYRVINVASERRTGQLLVAIRPFQVSPPWQSLNVPGGVTRIDSIALLEGQVVVDGRRIVLLSAPAGFGATTFDRGDICEYLLRGVLPEAVATHDPHHLASAALAYSLDLPPGGSRCIVLVAPFTESSLPQGPPLVGADAERAFAEQLTRVVAQWQRRLNRVGLRLPSSAGAVSNTILSNLAYILINRDGPAIKPGSRTYDRSWIRDGCLTSTALLQFGFAEEAKHFVDWFANYQYPNGKIPCVVDARGPDPVPENDSHGEFIHAVRQVFHFTHDTTWLEGKWPHVVKAVRYIQALRAERKSDLYRLGSAEQRACYGLLPESISHEGYSAKPMHSYWDDFFALRGLKDAAQMAVAVGDTELAQTFARERDDLRADLYNSMRQAMANAGIDFIPGCVELGDFDPTSTTIGVVPGGELGRIPEPQLHNTFERYFRFFSQRQKGEVDWVNYTPYEMRAIGTFVLLGQTERAQSLLKFFMGDRRPPGWNHWAEVVWRDPATPKFIGDMPHTWVGSDFIRSVRTMFVYEEEEERTLVVGAGLSRQWLEEESGVAVAALPTYYGRLTFSARRLGKRVRCELDVEEPSFAQIVVKLPEGKPIRRVKVNGHPHRDFGPKEVRLRTVPAVVEVQY